MNKSNQKFYALNGVADVPRTEIESIVDLAKQENNAEVIYRLSKVLRQNPDAKTFEIEIASYPTSGLTGAQHTGDYKEALDDCGRLRPGYRFMGGKVLKIEPKNLKSILRLFFKNKKQFDIQLESENITISKTYPDIYKFTHWQNGFRNLSQEIKFKEDNFNDFYAKFETLLNKVKSKNFKKQPQKVNKQVNLKTKFKIGDFVQIGDYGTKSTILSFRVNRKKEIIYKCKYIDPINEIYEASESELQLFKEPTPKAKVIAKTKKVVVAIDKSNQNPKPFSNKPKSTSVATAIADVLSLAKYKGTVKPLVANLLYKLFKNDLDAEITPDSDFEKALLQKDSPLHTSFYGEDVELTSLGIDFVKAVSGRLESLRNQKYNYAMFDGLAAPKKKAIQKNRKKPLKGFATSLATNLLANSLMAPEQKTETVAPVNSLAHRLQQRAKTKHEYYKVANKELSDFLGKIEKKTKESVAITIAGGQGSMKTRLCFQIMNALAQNYKVGHASIEEHPESALYFDKVKQYCNTKALHNISAPEINSIADVHKLVQENDVIVIDSFSKLQEMDKNCQLDKDFRKAYDGKLFIIIYQLTSDGKMRGGAKSQFDGDCIAFIEKKPNYTENYVWWDKNRYQSTPELKYNIYSGKIQKEPEPEAPKQKQHPKTETFSFEIV